MKNRQTKDCLFIHRIEGIIVEIRDGLDWKVIGYKTMFRLTAKEGEMND